MALSHDGCTDPPGPVILCLKIILVLGETTQLPTLSPTCAVSQKHLVGHRQVQYAGPLGFSSRTTLMFLIGEKQ